MVKIPIPEKWDYEADVIVVGAGTAGFPAAIVASDAGAEVVILEILPRLAPSLPLINVGPAFAGTDVQKEQGIEDSPEEYYKDGVELAKGNAELWRVFTDNQLETYYWCQEIGMNFDVGLMGPGNPANRSLARAGELMWRNFGGNIPNVTNCGVMGAPLFNAIPEDLDSLPSGWKGLNEEYDFKKDESVLYTFNFGRGGSTNIHRTEFSPGGYRAFVKSGHGGVARRLGVKGVPGPKNWMEYFIPGIWHDREGGITFFMLPQMAQALYDAGFKTKDAVYEWIYKASFTTMKDYRTHSWVDVNTNSWLGIEPTSGKPYKELPEDYMVSYVRDPYENCIIVTGSGEEYPQWVGSRRPGGGPAYSIDAWR